MKSKFVSIPLRVGILVRGAANSAHFNLAQITTCADPDVKRALFPGHLR